MAPPSPTILAKATKEELLNKLSEARIEAGLPEETERLKDLNKDELIRELVLVQHGAVSEGGAQALKEEEPSGRKSDSSEVMLAMVMKLMQDQQEWKRTLLEVLRETGHSRALKEWTLRKEKKSVQTVSIWAKWRQLKKKQNVDVKKKNVYVKKKNVDVKKKNVGVKTKNVDVKKKNVDVKKKNVDVKKKTSK
ncbi:Hypothetical protein FKW44_014155 [Caligus rogercresseyi]|uniref:Uncharacterized protein n=1 Tax=Caligus rogercresseyi TaxID=217165 RepID=A0A7T8GZC8_CALRO|nr:Hypothetical protein FKW44_014155 [Caligus rogercresseyi]